MCFVTKLCVTKKFGTNNSVEVRARVGYMESIMRVRACPCNAVAAVVPSM